MNAHGPLPRISLLLPIHNEAPYLRQCLDSILGQDFADFEVLISDNASTDDTWSVVRAYAARDRRIRARRCAIEIHVYQNLLDTLEMSSGELVYHIGGDDYFQSHSFLSRAIEPFEADPRLGAFITRLQYFDDQSGRELGLYPPQSFDKLLALEPLPFVRGYLKYCSHDELLVSVYRRELLVGPMRRMLHWGLESAGWWICLAAYLEARRQGHRYRFDSECRAVLMKRRNKPFVPGTAVSAAGRNVNERDSPASRVANSIAYARHVSALAARPDDQRAIRLALLYGMRRKTDRAPWFPGAGWSFLTGGRLWSRLALQLKERTPAQIMRRVLGQRC